MKSILLQSVFLISVLCCSAQQITPTNEHDRLEGILKRHALEKNSLLKNIPFRNAGPTIMSGRAVDVCVNPDDPTEFYVAYASGGLWHTVNNGQSFEPLFDHEEVITIGDIDVDWKTRNIWIGTGESNSSRSSYSGVGMYFSADSGKTWQHKGLAESQHIGKVLIHPSQQSTVFIAALGHLFSANRQRGLYKTTDGGNTYRQVLYIDESTGAADVVIDPKNPQVMYASMWHRERKPWDFIESGATSGIYKSTDGGETWSCVTQAGSGFPGGDGVGRIGLALFPGNTNIVYAILDNQAHKQEEPKKDPNEITVHDLKDISREKFLALNDQQLDKFLRSNGYPARYSSSSVKNLLKTDSIKTADVLNYLNDANNSLFDSPVIGAEVYRSDDAGKTWKKMNTTDLFNLSYTYGYYFGRITVSPVNPDKIIICGLPLLMSVDGGKTFSSIDGDNTHGDHHAVWINPKRDSHMIDCDDGGLHITYDNGKNWFKANSPPVGQFYTVNTDMAKPYNVYGGLQDNGVWYGPSTSNPADRSWLQSGQNDFKFLYGGDGMQVQIDTRDNNTVYTGYQFGYYARINKTTGESESIHPKNDIGEPNYRFKWQTPIWLSKHNQDILYMGTNRFMRSMNKGEEMHAISGDLTMHDKTGDVPFNTIVTICESPLKFGLLYVGTDDGLVWTSADDGSTWKNLSDNLYRAYPAVPHGLCVSRVTASAFHEGRLYVSLNGHHFDHFNPYIFMTDDNGNTWKEIGASLPFEPVNVIKEDVVNENLLFAGTDNGLYASLDRGKNFMSMNNGLPRVAIHDLVVHPREKELVLGTHGRSIYIAAISDLEMLTDSVVNKDLYVMNAEFKKNYSKSIGKKISPFSTDVYASAFSVPVYRKKSGITIVKIFSEKNTLLAQFTDSSEAGLNYISYDQHADSTAVKVWSKEKSEKSDAVKFQKAEDGKYYLLPGKYKMEISDESGYSQTTMLIVQSKEEKAGDADDGMMREEERD